MVQQQPHDDSPSISRCNAASQWAGPRYRRPSPQLKRHVHRFRQCGVVHAVMAGSWLQKTIVFLRTESISLLVDALLCNNFAQDGKGTRRALLGARILVPTKARSICILAIFSVALSCQCGWLSRAPSPPLSLATSQVTFFINTALPRLRLQGSSR